MHMCVCSFIHLLNVFICLRGSLLVFGGVGFRLWFTEASPRLESLVQVPVSERDGRRPAHGAVIFLVGRLSERWPQAPLPMF